MHSKIYFYRNDRDPRWIYLNLFGWCVFAFFEHGGWFYLNFTWFKEVLKAKIKRRFK